MITVSEYSDDLVAAWDDYVQSSEEGTLFHTIGWRRAVRRSFGHRAHYFAAFVDGKVRGILPLFEVRSRLFGHSLVSVPFGVYGGIVASDGVVYDRLRRKAEELAEQLQVDYLELRPIQGAASPLFDCVPAGANAVASSQLGATAGYPTEVMVPVGAAGAARTSERWRRKDLYVTFQREIYPTVEENLQAIPRKQRAMVRKGQSNGMSSRIGGVEDLEQFYRIYATNVRDLGSPVYPLDFFLAVMEELSGSFILSVWRDGQMVAGVLTFVFRDALLPYYGGGLREYFDLAINDFMYWELMKYGCANGYRMFDFGRSKRDTGSYKFKKHWGFEPTQLDYQYYMVKQKETPNLTPVNPKYRLMINTWKKLPLSVANWLGPKLVRGIP